MTTIPVMIGLLLLFSLFCSNAIVSAVYNERPCSARGGQCLLQSDCVNGNTARGLCPTQARNILCCLGSSSGGGSGGQCGCNYDYATRPTDGPAPGARRLADHFKSRFGGRTEIYNNRNVRGSSKTLSLHAEGRAVDLYAGGNGRSAFDYAVSIACQNGIQEVIFNRRIWTKSAGEHAYNGVNPHTDHVHIGLNRCGAANFGL